MSDAANRVLALEDENAELRGELARIVEHLSVWAKDHAEDATTETWAVIYCARALLTKERSPCPNT